MQIRCPICKKKGEWEENLSRPFCSERCKMIDLGNWASEAYRFPDKEMGTEEDQGDNGTNRNGQES